MSRPIIEVRNLTKRYRLGAIGATSLREEFNRTLDRLRGIPHPDKEEFWALRDVSFDVHPGEVVGVIGRNGAGKSTLLKILSRITEPTSGSATLRGRVASLLEVGTGFHPELTGRENVFLNGAILGMTHGEVHRKFDEIVAFAEVDQFIDTPVKRYSSGMYVRLAFAVAAHLEPEILIVDEVLAVGDAQFQLKCLGKIKNIADSNRTVLFVSHNMTAIETLCDRAIVLNMGYASTSLSTHDAILSYLARDSQDSLRWTGESGDTRLLLISVALRSNGNEVQLTSKTMQIDMCFRVLRPIDDLSIGLHLKTAAGNDLAFSALHDSRALSENYHFEPGEYTATVTIPPHTLAQGGYLIEPNFGVHNKVRIVKDVTLTFTIQNQGGLGRRFLTGTGLESRFRPAWHWDLRTSG